MLLEEEGILASAGSACNTGTTRISHVIEAIGTPKEYAYGTIRFSMGRQTSKSDVDRTIEVLKQDLHQTVKMEEEAVILYCLTKGYLDDVEVEEIASFEQSLYSDMKTNEAGIAISNHIKETKQLPDTQILDDYIKDFKARLM